MLGLCIVALVAIGITHWVYQWRNPRCNGKLPPGSMGWPLIGETLQYFAPSSSFDIPPFIKTRRERFGPIFKSSLVGRPLIVSTDPDFNHYIFQEEDKLFQCCYPDTFRKIIGRNNIADMQGFIHKYVKNMVLKLVGPENLKNMMPEIQQVAERTLHQWSCEDNIELKDASASMIFGLAAKKLISYDSNNSKEDIRGNFDAFIRGLISFPLDVPGTAYHKSLQGRKRVLRTLKTMLQERQANMRKQHLDFFDYVIEELNKDGTPLTEGMSLNLMFILLFASFETTSTATTLALKFLSDHPLVLKQLTEEHERILEQRADADSGLTWEEYKSMTFTFQFINETVRLANIAPGIFRKTMSEVQFKGYTIPAGWTVMVCPPAVHLNPAKYENPLEFNPWRWEGMGNFGASKDFLAFGGGMRFCVGADFAKVQMAVFLHCLLTNYRWKEISGGNIIRTPGVQFPDGFHIQILKKNKKDETPST